MAVQNLNKRQRHLLGDSGRQCVGLTTLPPSCAVCLQILEDSTFSRPNGLSRPVMEQLCLYIEGGKSNYRTIRTSLHSLSWLLYRGLNVLCQIYTHKSHKLFAPLPAPTTSGILYENNKALQHSCLYVIMSNSKLGCRRILRYL